MVWQFADDRPIYTQLIERISLNIISGGYPPGSKLPSVRDLAAEAAVNPNTMQRALTELEASGLVYSERTSGRFVTLDTALIADGKHRLAEQIINDFYRRMMELGVDKQEALDLAAKKKEVGTDG